ncbi:hypothetical protein CCYA_CCYA04G1264 [Cyanidiococcus yangmingshanensis]|nr:hypothetical protein CCYA_CCYA04G1264 [Cyanidiococcus yangmingshanensis]
MPPFWRGFKSSLASFVNTSHLWEAKHVIRDWQRLSRRCRLRSYSEAATTVEDPAANVGRVRNVGIVAHVDAGKTTLTEKILYYAGISRRVGNVDRGDTVMDYLSEERQRGITVQAAATSVPWRFCREANQKTGCLINIIDTPGHVDFTFEVERSLSVMDGAIVLIDAVAGVQAQTATVWRQAERYALPRIIFLNKCDRNEADITRCLTRIRSALGCRPVLLTAPVELDGEIGIADLLEADRLLFFEGLHGEVVRSVQMMPNTIVQPNLTSFQSASVLWSEFIRNQQESMIESLAECNDQLCGKYLDGAPIEQRELRDALRSATLQHQVVPVLCGSALHNVGVQPLLDAVVEFLPSPEECAPRRGETLDGGVHDVSRIPGDPLLAFAFKVQQDTHRGPLVFVRVFSSGASEPLKPGKVIKVLSADRPNWQEAAQERVNAVLRVHADHFTPVESAQSGGIYALSGLKRARTGDTLVSATADPKSVLRLPPIPIPEPMFSVALERDSGYQRSSQEALVAALQLLVRDDPSLRYHEDERTGELLLSGMGELHLDIAHKRLQQEFGLSDLRMSAPRVALYETIVGSSLPINGGDSGIRCADNINDQIPIYSMDRAVGATRLTAAMSVSVHSLGRDDHNGGIRLENEARICPAVHSKDDSLGGTNPSICSSVPLWMQRILIEGARAALRRGPRFGLPVIGTRAVIHQVLTESASEAALRACAAEAIHAALFRAKTSLVEPVMRVQILLDSSVMLATESNPKKDASNNDELQHMYGIVVRDLVSPQRRGQVLGADDSGTIVEALVPLEGLVGYATALRGLTAGRASFEAYFHKYELVDESFASRLLSRN